MTAPRDYLALPQMPLTAAKTALQRPAPFAPPSPSFSPDAFCSTPALAVWLDVDPVIRAGERGLFVSGSLADPDGAVAAVLLNSDAVPTVRLDTLWARVRRPLPVASDESGHDVDGFVAFIARDEPVRADERLHLDVILADGNVHSHQPLVFANGTRSLLSKLLATVDPDDPAVDQVVNAHLGPATAACLAVAPSPTTVLARRFGRSVQRPRVSIVMPVSGPRSDIDITLATLSGDPDMQRVEVVVATSRSAATGLAPMLDRYAGFYDLGGSLVIAEGADDDCALLDLGSAHAAGEFLLLMAPTVFPPRHGWLSRLLGAFDRAKGAGLISPLLLYEDNSVSFAGSEAPDLDRSVLPRSRLAGYPRDWVRSEGPIPSFAGALACSLIRRRVFADLGGFAGGSGAGFLTSAVKTMGLADRLRARGGRCYCDPEVALFALDDAAVAEPWQAMAERIDRWAVASTRRMGGMGRGAGVTRLAED